MVLKMFTVFDSKAEAWLSPFFLQSRGQAIRAFTDMANEPGHQFNKYAADFSLFEIGEYDDSKGDVKMLEAKVCLGIAIEFKSSPLSAVEMMKGNYEMPKKAVNNGSNS